MVDNVEFPVDNVTIVFKYADSRIEKDRITTERLGTLSWFNYGIQSGTYIVEALADGYCPASETIRVGKFETEVVDFDMNLKGDTNDDGFVTGEDINRALLRLMETGVYDEIYTKWYGLVFE